MSSLVYRQMIVLYLHVESKPNWIQHKLYFANLDSIVWYRNTEIHYFLDHGLSWQMCLYTRQRCYREIAFILPVVKSTAGTLKTTSIAAFCRRRRRRHQHLPHISALTFRFSLTSHKKADSDNKVHWKLYSSAADFRSCRFLLSLEVFNFPVLYPV